MALRGKKGSILVVEDDKDLRETICEIIKSFGYDIIEASSGSEALKCIIARKPDLIISDLLMNNGSGLDLAKAMTRNNVKIPLILMTGKRELQGECYTEPSINHIVYKPFKPQDLLNLVQELLKQQSA